MCRRICSSREGMGLGTFASGVYAALSGYVGESGAYPLNLMHFVSSSRGDRVPNFRDF